MSDTQQTSSKAWSTVEQNWQAQAVPVVAPAHATEHDQRQDQSHTNGPAAYADVYFAHG